MFFKPHHLLAFVFVTKSLATPVPIHQRAPAHRRHPKLEPQVSHDLHIAVIISGEPLERRDDVSATPVTFHKGQDPRVVGGARPGAAILQSDPNAVVSDSVPGSDAAISAAEPVLRRADNTVADGTTVDFHRDQDPRVVGGAPPSAGILSADPDAAPAKPASDLPSPPTTDAGGVQKRSAPCFDTIKRRGINGPYGGLPALNTEG